MINAAISSFVPNDSGPIYVETLRGTAPVIEPWNTTSNLVFLAILIYWFLTLRRDENRSPFIWRALPILLVGWVGGTIYHATRSHDVWFFMDFVPIALLAFGVGVYAWFKALGSWPKALVAILALALVSHGTMWTVRAAAGPLSDAFRSYVGLALNALPPLAVYAWRIGFRDWKWLAACGALFGLALTFRESDVALQTLLPMGSHFLWHLLGGASAHCLCIFLHKTEMRTASLSASAPTNPRIFAGIGWPLGQ